MAGTNVLSQRLDSKRIRLEGRVVANELRPGKSGVQQRLTINNNNVVFFAEFEGSSPLSVPVESRVAVTGVCSLDTDERRHITGFRVLVPQEDDVRVLVRPPLITTGGLVRIGAPIAAIIL